MVISSSQEGWQRSAVGVEVVGARQIYRLKPSPLVVILTRGRSADEDLGPEESERSLPFDSLATCALLGSP